MLQNYPNLTPEEVRKFLRISKATVYAMIEAGELPSKKGRQAIGCFSSGNFTSQTVA
jgi:predicted DNA-binding transcriptional regulator AlpA